MEGTGIIRAPDDCRQHARNNPGKGG